MRKYPTLKKLNAGEVIEIEGIKVKKIDGEIKPGDWYVAERNAGPKLLTAESIIPFSTDNTIDGGWINPSQGNAYNYDICECVRVCIIF